MKFSGASESIEAVPLRCLTNTLSRCGANWPTRTKARTSTYISLYQYSTFLNVVPTFGILNCGNRIALKFCSLVHLFSRIAHHLWPNGRWPCCALPWDLFCHCSSYQRLSSKHLRTGRLLDWPTAIVGRCPNHQGYLLP